MNDASIPTEYAKKKGAYTNKSSGGGWYWLRSPGSYDDLAAIVISSGGIYGDGNRVDSDNVGIRPALWLNLES